MIQDEVDSIIEEAQKPPEPEKPKVSEQFREMASAVNINLPKENVPTLDGMIALLTSIGGLSIVSSILADVIQPEKVSITFMIVRFCTGLIMISVGYGILKRKGYTVWLYGGVSIVGLAVNPVIAIVPILITIYLYTQGSYFDVQLLGKVWARMRGK